MYHAVVILIMLTSGDQPVKIADSKPRELADCLEFVHHMAFTINRIGGFPPHKTVLDCKPVSGEET